MDSRNWLITLLFWLKNTHRHTHAPSSLPWNKHFMNNSVKSNEDIFTMPYVHTYKVNIETFESFCFVFFFLLRLHYSMVHHCYCRLFPWSCTMILISFSQVTFDLCHRFKSNVKTTTTIYIVCECVCEFLHSFLARLLDKNRSML